MRGQEMVGYEEVDKYGSRLVAIADRASRRYGCACQMVFCRGSDWVSVYCGCEWVWWVREDGLGMVGGGHVKGSPFLLPGFCTRAVETVILSRLIKNKSAQ